MIFRSVGQRSVSKVNPILYMLGKGALVFYKHLYLKLFSMYLLHWNAVFKINTFTSEHKHDLATRQSLFTKLSFVIIIYICPKMFKSLIYRFWPVCLYTVQGKYSFHFTFAHFTLWYKGQSKTGWIELYMMEYVKQIDEWANSRLGKSVSDLNRAKIRLGKFKAVYSMAKTQPLHNFWTVRENDFLFCLNCSFNKNLSNDTYM